MRIVATALLTVAILLSASPAAAKQYYYCYVRNYGDDVLQRYTPILATDAEDIDDTQTGFAFGDHVGHIDNNASKRTGCTSSRNLAYLQKGYQIMLKDSAGATKVNWANPPVPSQPVEEGAAGFHITVEDSRRASQIEAWENSVLQMHRESAALQAKTIALTAASRADYDRLLAKVKAEMKKRGNRQ